MSRFFLLGPALLLAVQVTASPQNTTVTGTIAGVVRDGQGDILPGVTLMVTVGAVEFKTVTDPQGRYSLDAVPAGSHTIRATLRGFAWREARVEVRPGSSARVDFVLCPESLRFIDWIAPPEQLSDLLARVEIVAYVRVTALEASEEPCRGATRLKAAVLESVKPSTVNASHLTFWQEQWHSEPTPYPVGSELVVFLNEWNGKLVRSHGPTTAFPVEKGKVMASKFLAYRNYGGMPIEQFLRELRAMK